MRPPLFLTLVILLILPSCALADNAHEMESIYLKHLHAFEQLSRHHLRGQTSDGLPLPGQKNIYQSQNRRTSASKNDPGRSGTPSIPIEHTFKADTVWTVITVRVTDNQGSFRVSGECDSPVSGWLLKTKAKAQIAKGSLNDQRSFSFTVNEPFRPDLELTLYVTKERYTNPAFIALY